MSGRFPSRYLIMDDEIVTKRASSYFRRDLLTALLNSRQAYNLCWARAVKCPCTANVQTEQPDPSCPYCYGVLGNLPGWRYVLPRADVFPEEGNSTGSVAFDGGELIRGLVSNQGIRREQEKQGEWEFGTATLSVRPETPLGYYDRLIMVDAVMPYDQVLTRTAGTTTLATGRDEQTQLRYPIVEVLDARSTTARFRERVDFAYDPNNSTLSWVAGRGPAVGERFSLRYRYHPRWIVVDLPRASVGHNYPGKEFGLRGKWHYSEMSQRATVKLDFLL